MGGNCPSGSCPGENYSGAIVWGECPGEILCGTIIRGAVVQGGIVTEPRKNNKKCFGKYFLSLLPISLLSKH